MGGNENVCVIIPAYNESKIIGDVLANLIKLGYTVVVVDDGSTDESWRQASLFPVILLRHPCNLGQGAALQTGISYVLRNLSSEYIITYDADGQHVADDIPRLISCLQTGQYDVVLGSRFLVKNTAVNIRWSRRALLRLALWFTRVSTGLNITDTHNGLRAFTRQAAGSFEITHNRMAHASDILAQIANLKLRYCEVPVTVLYTSYSMAKGQTFLDGFLIIWDILTGKMR